MLTAQPEDIGIHIPPYRPLPAELPFASFVLQGSLIHVSGQIPDTEGLDPIRGQLGAEVRLEVGRDAARRAALNAIAVLQHAAGDLVRVRRILKLTGFVNSAPGFVEQPAVINGASEVFVELWGRPNGLHSRSAIGVAALPFGVPVEIEVLAELEEA